MRLTYLKLIALTSILFIILLPHVSQGFLFGSPNADKYAPFKEGREWEFLEIAKENNVITQRVTKKISVMQIRKMEGKDLIPLKCVSEKITEYGIPQKDFNIIFYNISSEGIVYFAEQTSD